MNDILNDKRSVRGSRNRNRQRGALLVTLIITMVILSALGGALVYIFSSSALNPVSGNFAQRAYYNAEAGFRYVTALYRQTGQMSVFIPYIAGTAPSITLPDGGDVTVNMTAPTAEAAASATGTGSAVVITGNTSGFPSPVGFFSPVGSTAHYRYTNITTTPTKTGTTTTLTGIYPSITTSWSDVPIKTKPQTVMSSKGSFGSGLLAVNREVKYTWAISGYGPGGTPPTSGPSGPISFVDNPLTFAGGLGGGPSSKIDTESATEVDLRAASPAKCGIISNKALRYYSNYDVQVKVEAKAGDAGNATNWNVGLLFNGQENADHTITGNGYYLTYLQYGTVNVSKINDYNYPPLASLVASLNTAAYDGPILVLWKQVQVSEPAGWIAYAKINATSVYGGIQQSGSNWNLYAPSTLVVKMIRTETSNIIRVYFGSPTTYSGGNEVPTDINRLGYAKWVDPWADPTSVKWPSFDGTWPSTNDYFTMASNNNTSILQWVKNPADNSIELSNDMTTLGTSIPNAVITSTTLVGNTYSAIGLFVENTSDPYANFYDLAVNAAGQGFGGPYIDPIQQ